MIFVISDRPTLIFQKTYHYNGLKRPYERKYILYLLYKFDLLLRHYKALPENQVARDAKRPRGVGVLMIKPVYQPEPIRAHDIPVFSQTTVLTLVRSTAMHPKGTCFF